MSRPFGSVDIGGVFEEVVEQFGDPYAFFRELVQNSIDAGTGRVEIRLEFDDNAGSDGGRATIHVRDWGEGMDRAIIEERLLRLFRSGKEEDYTKIGRFGIGFVSVFAIEPDVVCVDTGRSGEYWRVLFDDEPRYELLELDRPIEGTHVRLFKKVDRSEVERMRRRSRRALAEWCRHAEIPVLFEGDDVRSPFEVAGPCTARYTESGTRIVAGYVSRRQAHYGYYNRGLKLEEGAGGRWPHVSFKVDSRYLDHTVARDGVVEDGTFHKAKERLERLVEERLPKELVEELERAASAVSDEVEDVDEVYASLAARLAETLASSGAPVVGWRERPLIPTTSGEAVSVAKCEAELERERLYLGPGRPFARAREPELVTIPTVERGGSVGDLLESALGRRPPRFRDAFARITRAEVDESTTARRLASELQSFFRHASSAPDSITFGDMGERAAARRVVAVVVDRPGEGVWFDELPSPTLSNIDGSPLWFNVEHEAVQLALDVAGRAPVWAAYNLAKLLTVEELTPEEDLGWVRRLADERGPLGGRTDG